MRILLAATRRIHTLAVSLHILALRVGVWGSNRAVGAAMAATDAAKVIREEAAKAYTAVATAEKQIVREASAFNKAAQAEADSLRRGVSL